MLCRRSASLISSTRASSAMASSSLRKFSAWTACLEAKSSLLSLVRRIDEAADLDAEHGVDLLAGDRGVLDRVVQHGRGDGRVVEPELGEDGGDFERMREIGIAGGALLRAVRLHGEHIGAVQQILVRLRIVAPHALHQFVLPHHVGGKRLGVGFASGGQYRDRRRRAQGARATAARSLHGRDAVGAAALKGTCGISPPARLVGRRQKRPMSRREARKRGTLAWEGVDEPVLPRNRRVGRAGGDRRCGARPRRGRADQDRRDRRESGGRRLLDPAGRADRRRRDQRQGRRRRTQNRDRRL